MEPSGQPASNLKPSQRLAVEARGNVLVMAGAGTGKTKTLIARCLDCLERERASLDELLIVTFTEAAAAEMRQRLRTALTQKIIESPGDDHWPHQLALFDIAHIGTLHSFCLRLIREHFHELGLDPQLTILDEGAARQLADETMADQFAVHYEGGDTLSIAFQALITEHGGGRDEKIRQLVLRLHHYSQARPDAAGWLAQQAAQFSADIPGTWPDWLLQGIHDWRAAWLPVLDGLRAENSKAAELLAIFQRLPSDFTRAQAAETMADLIAADNGEWPKGKKTILRKPLESLLNETEFLHSLATIGQGTDPLIEDWNWVRHHLQTLLQLAQEFAALFANRKRHEAALDFHDLEQFTLRLLWDFTANQPSVTAITWRAKLRFVFVDEYQDINAAQDRIIAALAGEGLVANRFLVGDVKQSIYRFRLADPKIFRDYARDWHDAAGQTIPLSENFRSRAGILHFVNSVFSLLMRPEIGGVAYDDAAKLIPGLPDTAGAAPAPRVELLIRKKIKPGDLDEDDELADVEEAALEARIIARHLQQLIASGHQIREEGAFRPARYSDIAILLRSPRGKSEVYAREFDRMSVPLTVARGGFFQSAEILDLLSLLQLLDNPLQDVPCLAVLRSPIVSLSLDDLARIRLAAAGDKHFWTALARFHETSRSSAKKSADPLAAKVAQFLDRFSRWRKLARQGSLSECLEAILTETLFADWLRTRPRGEQRVANLERFLNLAEQFDQFQRQGLFRFLQFISAQEAAGSEPEVSAAPAENAVRLMSIHQSKGLEFPIVALPDLAKMFNEQDLRADIIFDEKFGLCPRVKPPHTGRRYPSLPYWLAQQRQKRELRGEELRLLYVAFTRARDTLVLTATVGESQWKSTWTPEKAVTDSDLVRKIGRARSYADWLGLWFARNVPAQNVTEGETDLLRWRFVEDTTIDTPATETASAPAEAQVIDLDAKTADRLRGILEWEYPHEAATYRKAKSSVTELRRAAEELDEEAGQLFTPPLRRSSRRASAKLSAVETGNAHHKFLQYVALDKTDNITTEADRLTRENFLTPEECAALDISALGAFWQSDLGQKVRAQAAAVRRELPFTARFKPEDIASIIGDRSAAAIRDEFIIVQGVADLVVLLPAEIWLIDFKTDDLRKSDLPAKVELYKPQLRLYALALEQIFSKPVKLKALHFLSLGETREI